MGPPFEQDPRPDEREIRSLSERSGVSLGEVRTLVRHEFARLKMGAKVGSYLDVLTASNVRGMLRRKARLTAAVPQPAPAPTKALPPHLRRWEDDGGSVDKRMGRSVSAAEIPMPLERVSGAVKKPVITGHSRGDPSPS